MIELLADIVARLRAGVYPNEAAVREGIVVPILRALGWDTFDPGQVQPEFHSAAGFIDYALLRNRRPIVLIEVKAVGRSLEGDKQLFRYCFEEGVPLAVLTDGRGWNFYLPGGLGRLDERRVYSLQLDDRSASDSTDVLNRYLARYRVIDRSAIAAAQEDHDRATDQREATAALPEAWSDLVVEEDERIVEALQDKAEAVSGFRPSSANALEFLQGLHGAGLFRSAHQSRQGSSPLTVTKLPIRDVVPPATLGMQEQAPSDRLIDYTLFGERCSAPNASRALVDILRVIVARDLTRIEALSEKVRSRGRSHIARTPQEINPKRPDLARGEEIATGWLVGLTISNRDKAMIIRTACEIFSLECPRDVDLTLPNA